MQMIELIDDWMIVVLICCKKFINTAQVQLGRAQITRVVSPGTGGIGILCIFDS